MLLAGVGDGLHRQGNQGQEPGQVRFLYLYDRQWNPARRQRGTSRAPEQRQVQAQCDAASLSLRTGALAPHAEGFTHLAAVAFGQGDDGAPLPPKDGGSCPIQPTLLRLPLARVIMEPPAAMKVST